MDFKCDNLDYFYIQCIKIEASQTNMQCKKPLM